MQAAEELHTGGPHSEHWKAQEGLMEELHNKMPRFELSLNQSLMFHRGNSRTPYDCSDGERLRLYYVGVWGSPRCVALSPIGGPGSVHADNISPP